MKNVFKLSLLAASTASLLLASTISLAGGNYKGDYKAAAVAPCPKPLTLDDGFYLGLGAGYDSYRVRTNDTFNAVDGTVTATHPAINPTGFLGELFAGYGRYFNDIYYLGGELAVNDSSASVTNNSTITTDAAVFSTSNTFKAQGSYGVALLPGVKLNDSSLFYLRFGYNRTYLKGQYSSGSFSNNQSQWTSGYGYGLGIESAFTQNWSVRGQYTHTGYNSFSSNANTSIGSASSNYVPSDNQFMLDLVYHIS